MRAQHPHPSPKPRCAIGSEKVLKNHRDRRAQNDLPFVINEAAIQHLIDVAQAAGDKIVVPAVDAQTNFIDSITDHGQNPINGYVLPATTKKTKKSNNHPDSDDENSGQDRLVGSLVNLCSMIMLIVCAHFF